MAVDINKIVAELLGENKKAKANEDYKKAYLDGVFDFFNKMKKENGEEK